MRRDLLQALKAAGRATLFHSGLFAAESPAGPVADLVARHRREERADHEDDDVDAAVGRRGQEARAEEDRVAGEQEPEQQPALGEQEAPHDRVDGDRRQRGEIGGQHPPDATARSGARDPARHEAGPSGGGPASCGVEPVRSRGGRRGRGGRA